MFRRVPIKSITRMRGPPREAGGFWGRILGPCGFPRNRNCNSPSIGKSRAGFYRFHVPPGEHELRWDPANDKPSGEIPDLGRIWDVCLTERGVLGMNKARVKMVLLALFVFLVAIQIFQPRRTNPPVVISRTLS